MGIDFGKVGFKAKPGDGWLRELNPQQIQFKTSPPFRGLLHIPEDLKKGRKVKLVGWLQSNSYGTMFYVKISTKLTRRRFRLRIQEEKEKEAAEYKKIIERKAKFEVGPPKRKYVPKPPQPPKEVKRKDVIR